MTIAPAEWAPQRAMFTAFPSDPELWEGDLDPARVEVAAMVTQLAQTVRVKLLASGERAAAAARQAVSHSNVDILDVPFGDIWLRDTAPIFLTATLGAAFRFNGWGGKYVLTNDEGVWARVADAAGATVVPHDFVLEGGAIDGDGSGLFVTTEQCLLHQNRNPDLGKREIELALRDALGARRILWLGEGLVGDHTDGHVDNLARFVAPGTLMIPVSAGPDDPNAAIFADARARARDGGCVVLDMPSVGRFVDTGDVRPASYMNFVIANGQVIVPLYGVANDGAAIRALEKAFPRHRVTGLPATHILTGGGSFHCITQQQPEV